MNDRTSSSNGVSGDIGSTSPVDRNDSRRVAPEPLERSKVRLGRDIFHTIFSLTTNQPWLKEKQSPLLNLIDDCTNQNQQLLVCDLLQRFLFLDGAAFSSAIQQIVEYIEADLNFSANDCSISASENGRFIDSSQYVVYSLKSARWKSNSWNTSSFVSGLRELVKSAPRGNLIIVDEFIGTGETAEKKIKWLRDQLAGSGSSARIYFAAVAGMSIGVKRLSESVDGVFCAHVLTKGISDYYSPDQIQGHIDEMKILETTLADVGRRGKLSTHSLGYKASESLYSRAGGNTPNNVFPIFWWEANKDGSIRDTLLTCI